MEFEGTLKNIVDSNLKWIFVGGKGGVGKTTTSSSIATMLALKGKKVMIISTDPAHNLSDCFDQKFSGEATAVEGVPNLFAMEIDPKVNLENLSFSELGQFEPDQSSKNFLEELVSNVPGIDEAMAFGKLMASVNDDKFDTIVFDTAPTGHTLKFLNFPNLLSKGLEKAMVLKEKFGGMIN